MGESGISCLNRKVFVQFPAEIPDTKYKAEALQLWLKGKEGFAGGIVVPNGPNGWMVNNNNNSYQYTQSLSGWKDISDFLK